MRTGEYARGLCIPGLKARVFRPKAVIMGGAAGLRPADSTADAFRSIARQAGHHGTEDRAAGGAEQILGTRQVGGAKRLALAGGATSRTSSRSSDAGSGWPPKLFSGLLGRRGRSLVACCRRRRCHPSWRCGVGAWVRGHVPSEAGSCCAAAAAAPPVASRHRVAAPCQNVPAAGHWGLRRRRETCLSFTNCVTVAEDDGGLAREVCVSAAILLIMAILFGSGAQRALLPSAANRHDYFCGQDDVHCCRSSAAQHGWRGWRRKRIEYIKNAKVRRCHVSSLPDAQSRGK